jgi:predicted nucleotidyltransferase
LADWVEVAYDQARWRLFRRLRSETADMLQPLAGHHIESLAYGSIARGDVSDGSDVDIFVPKPPAPTLLETLVERAGFTIVTREIVQATPTYAAKGYIYIEENRSYSFPLVQLRTIEREFYDFAGSINLKGVEEGIRVPGVDKRLMLIEPTEKGHVESPIKGREDIVAKELGIGVTAVLDRVRTLLRREKVGRTGVYIKRILAPEQNFGDALQQLARHRPALRRRLRM